MFEPSSDTKLDLSWAIKGIAGSAVGVGIGFGLCSVGLGFLGRGAFSFVQTLGLAVFGISILSLVVCALCLVIGSIINTFRK